MDIYNGKTVRLKCDKYNMVKNTMTMIKKENLNIKRFCEKYLINSSDIIYITEIDEKLDICDKLCEIESSTYMCYFASINETHIKMCIDDILKIFKLHSTNYTKKYIKHCDVIKYDFYVPVIKMALKKNNFKIEQYKGDHFILKYIVKIKGKNKYLHDSSKKFPLNILLNDIPRCVSPDWYLRKHGYYEEKQQHDKNRKNIKNDIKNQLIEL